MPNSVKLRKVLAVMRELGFSEIRGKCSHAFFVHPDGRTTVIPMHDEIRSGLLTKIIKKDIGMGAEEFYKLL